MSLRSARFSLLFAAIVALGLASACSRRGAGRGSSGAANGAANGAASGDDESVELSFGGRTRYYLLHVPPSARGASGAPTKPLPLVVALHGGGGRPERTDEQMGWSKLSDRESFVLVYPAGVDHAWNDGREDNPTTTVREGVDDVGFLSAVMDDVAARVSIDKRRVYMTGMSNGAFMSSRFACERAERVASIGLVVGTIGPNVLARCRPARPVSVIAWSGTSDPLVPFEGGAVHLGRFERGQAASAADTARLWTTQAKCDRTVLPASRVLPDSDPNDGSTVRLDEYPCAEAAVAIYTVQGGGHTWPGGKQYLSSRFVGSVNRDVQATEVIWAFFAAHPIPPQP